jgi:hypothetical protein
MDVVLMLIPAGLLTLMEAAARNAAEGSSAKTVWQVAGALIAIVTGFLLLSTLVST